ncbi:MAG: phospholipid carrier-dependent glycosyltransferase [Chloroflexi bacterium]|nr:phospholipid carrier-dependent glycosyltransferase [Chloroflexota bacterium]
MGRRGLGGGGGCLSLAAKPNPQRLIFLGRLATIWLTLLLGALVYRWGRQLHSPTAGLMALALLVLDPNILAHGQLVTSDLPLTLFMVMAVYGFWLWGVRKERRNSGNP